MTTPHIDNRLLSSADPARSRPPETPRNSLRGRLALAAQVALALAFVGGVAAYLLRSGTNSSSPDEEKRASRPEEVVTVAGPRTLRVRPGTPLDSKLEVATVQAAWLTAPVLPVTGTMLASLRPAREETLEAGIVALLGSPRGKGSLLAISLQIAGKTEAKDAWQFATPERSLPSPTGKKQ
jgi:hypothetical protein